MNQVLKEKLKSLPDSPGCYLMKENGQIIYVGKAKNLKNRVRSYFQSREQSPKTMALVSRIEDFDIILCQSELDAFLLENNLIKKHQPHYNILLKDDKSYPYLRMNLNESFPRISIARKPKKDGAKYFGPYIGAGSVKQVLELLQRLYPIRNCKLSLPLKAPCRPCLQYQLGACPAPCARLIDEEGYKKIALELQDFLNGNTSKAKALLKEKIDRASSELNFERAKEYYDSLKSLDRLFGSSSVESANGESLDVFAIHFDDADACISLLNVREGKLIATRNFILENESKEDEDSLIEEALLSYYRDNIPAKEIVVKPFENRDGFMEYLSSLYKFRVYFSDGARGRKRELFLTARKNAMDALRRRAEKNDIRAQREEIAMQELMKALGFSEDLKRMEAFDISNTQGTLSVASMTVMLSGKIAPKEYRHFRIKTVEGANDFASMKEVLTRRLQRSIKIGDEKPWPLPDVILIDGGKQQLRFALEAMHELKLSIPIFSLAERFEEVFLPNREESILLDRRSNALRLIVRLRDEAHRFAISYHRGLRNKTMTKSSLESIEGIGPARRRQLLLKFGSIKNLQGKSLEEISSVKGMNKKSAEKLYEWLHKEEKN